MDASFRAGGLASGLDSNNIIDTLVSLEKRPIDMLSKRQQALKAQVSLLGDLASKLSSLSTAAGNLQSKGVLALKASSSPTSFSVTPTTGGAAGRYSVEVTGLASAAKARSQAFATGDAPITGGTLDLSVMGSNYQVTITDGMTLTEVATAINQSGAPVNASVLASGTSHYLTLTNRDTGYPLTGAPGDALGISMTTTGTQGTALALGITQQATNATFLVDGLPMTRTSNEVTGAIPGVTLSLKSLGAAEDVVLGYDYEATQKNLQAFVTAYNEVQALVQKQLAVKPESNRGAMLAGDAVVRNLQSTLQRIVSTTVPGLATVRSLADLGVQTSRDGSLTIDTTKLQAAVAREPGSVNALFGKATTGLGDVVEGLVDTFTDPVNGLITARKSGLNDNIRAMDSQLERLDARLAGYRQNLIRQFAAMEQVVSGIKSIGNYLTNNPFPKIGGNE
ncbi:MAG: flagellar filament capping protein FliD [Myxococcaceae bacterium]|nr:flagellar filament capping protein FliD [Myxococcaceae bacterium]